MEEGKYRREHDVTQPALASERFVQLAVATQHVTCCVEIGENRDWPRRSVTGRFYSLNARPSAAHMQEGKIFFLVFLLSFVFVYFKFQMVLNGH